MVATPLAVTERGPVIPAQQVTATGQALVDGEISPAHAQVLAHGTQELPTQVAAEAEPVLLAAAQRLDPPRLRRAIAHLRLVADPEGADAQAERRHQRRGPWVAPRWEGMVAVDGCWTPRPARPCWPRWSRWPARPAPAMSVAPPGVGLTGWPSWPAATWRAAGCPRAVGCGPSCW